MMVNKMLREAPKWNFKALDFVTYEVTVSAVVNNKHLEKLFNRAKWALKKSRGVDVRGSVGDVDRFEVPVSYYRLVKTYMSSVIGQVERDVKADGIVMLDYNVKECFFLRRKDNNWDLVLVFRGAYDDRR